MADPLRSEDDPSTGAPPPDPAAEQAGAQADQPSDPANAGALDDPPVAIIPAAGALLTPLANDAANDAGAAPGGGEEAGAGAGVGAATPPESGGGARGEHGADTGQASRLRVADIQIDSKDSRKHEITYVYMSMAPEYAIYHAGDVSIQYADDPLEAQKQRQNLKPVAALRAELNALLKGWRDPTLYYWKLAYGLQLALEGSGQDAQELLLATKKSLVTERASAGRWEYLVAMAAVTVAMMILLTIADKVSPFTTESDNIWLAAKAGLFGAAFSIAIAIRGRSTGLDIDRLDNVMDGALRLGIGVISAVILLLLLSAGVIPSVTVGDATVTGSEMTWKMVIIVGFVGGFLERLVPDLLDKRAGTLAGTPGGSALNPVSSPPPASTPVPVLAPQASP